jgi:hypothetical protein
MAVLLGSMVGARHERHGEFLQGGVDGDFLTRSTMVIYLNVFMGVFLAGAQKNAPTGWSGGGEGGEPEGAQLGVVRVQF